MIRLWIGYWEEGNLPNKTSVSLDGWRFTLIIKILAYIPFCNFSLRRYDYLYVESNEGNEGGMKVNYREKYIINLLQKMPIMKDERKREFLYREILKKIKRIESDKT